MNKTKFSVKTKEKTTYARPMQTLEVYRLHAFNSTFTFQKKKTVKQIIQT